MADEPPSFDLRLTPDWLKESEPVNRYADYEGDDAASGFVHRRKARREERSGRPSRPPDRTRRDQPRPSQGRPPQAGPARTTEFQPGGNRPTRSPASVGPRPRREDQPPPTELELAPVQIDFLPEERAFAKIIQQIKQGHTAYPLFGLARMFLERPERHRIRVRSLNNASMLYQFGDFGPVALEAGSLERVAFQEKKDDYYSTEIVEKEPVKGVFSSVARCSLSGKLLGPTNYHAFQPTIRALYEQRFSRRMSFEEYRRTVEITSDPVLVEQWKEEARRTTTYRTKKEDSAVTLQSLAAVEQHFKTNYLPLLVKACLAAEFPGDLARHLPDRRIAASIRLAREKENRFPAQIAGALRHGLNHAGLHVFKHKKRILYISAVRPLLFDSNQASVSSGLSAILNTLRSFPKITRKQLAEKILPSHLAPTGQETEAYTQAKAALVGDLLWLAKAGHVIEFADGSLDLPLPPKPVDARPESALETASETPALSVESELASSPPQDIGAANQPQTSASDDGNRNTPVLAEDTIGDHPPAAAEECATRP
jgi:hypothetical protein